MLDRLDQRLGREIPYKIKNELYVIRQIGQYGDPVNAIREFVSNGIDAQAKKILAVLNKPESQVMIYDDGYGMSERELLTLPQSIGESIKRGRGFIGEKGLGYLGFMTLGPEAYIITRPSGSSEYYGLKSTLRGTRSFRPTPEEVPFGPFEQGTRILVRYVPEETMKAVSSKKILEELSDIFDYHVRKGLEIHIGELTRRGKIKTNRVPSLEYTGNLILDDSLDVDYEDEDGIPQKGLVEFYIFLDPQTSLGRVRVLNRGVRILKSISQTREFSSQPWNSGNLLGYINSDFLEPTVQRDDIVRDRYGKFQAWYSTVKGYEDLLNQKVGEIERESKESEAQRLAYDILREVDAIYRELERMEELGLRHEVLTLGREGDEVKTVIETDISAHTRIGGKGRAQRGRRTQVIEDPSGTERPTRKATSVDYSPVVEPFPPNEARLRSKLAEEPFRQIFINQDHPHYQEVFSGKDSRKKMRYVAHLVCKELAHKKFKDEVQGGIPGELVGHDLTERWLNIYQLLAERLNLE